MVWSIFLCIDSWEREEHQLALILERIKLVVRKAIWQASGITIELQLYCTFVIEISISLTHCMLDF
jgi:hypothetical protein